MPAAAEGSPRCPPSAEGGCSGDPVAALASETAALWQRHAAAQGDLRRYRTLIDAKRAAADRLRARLQAAEQELAGMEQEFSALNHAHNRALARAEEAELRLAALRSRRAPPAAAAAAAAAAAVAAAAAAAAPLRRLGAAAVGPEPPPLPPLRRAEDPYLFFPRTVHGQGEYFHRALGPQWTVVGSPEEATLVYERQGMERWREGKMDPRRQRCNRFPLDAELSLADKAGLLRTLRAALPGDPGARRRLWACPLPQRAASAHSSPPRRCSPGRRSCWPSRRTPRLGRGAAAS
eukprot:TRINITY_DN5958_c0_g1_i3.p3 TRINITY_DN5958_c0_g1~~TRINITY_DN5958_c0_g1_i3.p3  ORF type:complete len:319 (+),score=55.47 TRINITY_DN5958_c0_g1_i3:84-959(+)